MQKKSKGKDYTVSNIRSDIRKEFNNKDIKNFVLKIILCIIFYSLNSSTKYNRRDEWQISSKDGKTNAQWEQLAKLFLSQSSKCCMLS